MLTGYIITAQGQNVNRILKNFLFFSKKYFFFLKSSKKWLKSGAFERKKGICRECGDGDGSKKTKKNKEADLHKTPHGGKNRDRNRERNAKRSMENNQKQEKIGRILYIAIIGILCVTAVVIGITAAANRGSKTPVSTTAPVTTARPTTTAAPVTTAPPTTTAAVLPDFLSPAVGVVAKEHDTTTPVFSLTTNDWRTHTGIDIACAIGDAVYAAADGTVTMVASDPMMGTTVTISHAGEGETVYQNLAVTLPEGITEGARVIAGQVIGTVGDTAMIESADEPHLHFMMKVKGVYVDPMDYITEESKNASLTVNSSYES